MEATKKIFHYVKGTGLCYPCDDNLELTGYSDSNYIGCKLDRKSTSGTCQFLMNKLVTWFSKKQTSIATTTTGAEYMTVGRCCAQILWLKQQLKDYEAVVSEVPIFCDSSSAIAITQNPVLHTR